MLGSLANNGGPTRTFALLTGSPAIDGVTFNGSNSAPSTDQRDVARPQGVRYDIGAFELDNTPPTVVSVARANTNPTKLASVHFTATFSEPVSGVNTTDFTLTKAGTISGASVTSVSGSGATRTITVFTGTGNGTIRLNIPASATINDLAGNHLASLPYTNGQIYTVNKVTTVYLPLLLR